MEDEIRDTLLLTAAGSDTISIPYSTAYTKQSPASLTNMDTIATILKDVQNWENFKRLLAYCDYYINYDSMASGAIKNIMVPFSQTEYRLVGGNEKSRKFFAKWLDVINFKDIIAGMSNDYHKYGQAYLYLHDNDSLQVLPPFRCMIESLAVNGEPVISFELDRTISISKTDISSIERKYSGYPTEVAKAAKSGSQYAQLRLGHTFGVFGTKAYWEKYSLPILTSSLPWLLEKETLNGVLINELENMKRSFLEVQIGDKDILQKPNKNEYEQVTKMYQQAVSQSGVNLAVVSWNVQSKWIQANSKDVLNNLSDSISFINWNILSSLSISPILAAGDAPPNKATASSFSTTQAAIGIVNKRINTFLRDVEKVLNKIMQKVGENQGFKSTAIPSLVFDVVDLGKEDKLANQLMELYKSGLVSAKTVLDYSDFSYDQELANKQNEIAQGLDKVFNPASNAKSDTNSVGRPTMDVNDRTSDLDESLKNDIPSPSDE